MSAAAGLMAAAMLMAGAGAALLPRRRRRAKDKARHVTPKHIVERRLEAARAKRRRKAIVNMVRATDDRLHLVGTALRRHFAHPTIHPHPLANA